MIVVDASVAVKWVFAEAYSEQAGALLDASLRANEPIAAPWLLPFELTNVVRQRMRRFGLPVPDAERLLAELLGFHVRLSATDDLHRRALSIAGDFGLAAAYDAHYVALANMLQCDLWTDDRRLLSALRARLPFVRWIGDYA